MSLYLHRSNLYKNFRKPFSQKLIVSNTLYAKVAFEVWLHILVLSSSFRYRILLSFWNCWISKKILADNKGVILAFVMRHRIKTHRKSRNACRQSRRWVVRRLLEESVNCCCSMRAGDELTGQATQRVKSVYCTKILRVY